MFKLLKNKKGQVVTGAALGIAIFIGITVTVAVTKTANNGTLKKNGRVIWCKMQGKDAALCDAILTE